MEPAVEEKAGDKPSSADRMAASSNADLTAELFCFNIGRLSKCSQFCLTTAIVLGFFLIYGYFLELLFRLEGMRNHSWYLTMVQFFYYILFGGVEKLSSGWHKPRQAPFKVYLVLAFLTVATMGLSNMAVGYLNYPTQVIFKCCKLIPVLVGGIIIQGKKYGLLDFTACLCMSIGLILFTLADSEVQPNFNIYGVVLISGALCADAVIGNVQEKTMKQYSVSNAEVILYSYSVGFLYIFGGLMMSGNFLPAFTFFSQHPVETYGYAIIFSLTGYLGVNAVLSQVKIFGALAAVTVTTFRKMVTIILSFIIFSKPFTFHYVWSGLIVVLGIYLNLYSKNRSFISSITQSTLDLLRQKRSVSSLKHPQDSIV